MNEEKVLEALSTIKQICKSCKTCELCPLSNENAICMIRHSQTESWEIKKRTKVMYME